MKIRVTAPEGYKYMDTRTGNKYSEIVIDDSKRNLFALVPATDNPVEM